MHGLSMNQLFALLIVVLILFGPFTRGSFR